MAGLLDKRREGRDDVEIPTSSMADIAFLLLIFFLVTTTINVDTGIGMNLPPKLEGQEPPPVKDRNMFRVLVNAQGDVLIDDQPASVQQIRERVKEHVLNYGQNPNLSDSPNDAVISIKTSAETPYRTYIKTLDEVWMAYREIWDSVARSGKLPNGERVLDRTYSGYQAYRSELDPEDTNTIRENFKANISIAEPDTGE
jgi:biopolymer transport protein ExbD